MGFIHLSLTIPGLTMNHLWMCQTPGRLVREVLKSEFSPSRLRRLSFLCSSNTENNFLPEKKGFFKCYFLFFSYFCLFKAAPAAYGGSQARRLIGATAAGLHQSNSNPRSKLYTTAHGNTGSLTHWARPGIEPETSWFLVGFASAAPWWELQMLLSFFFFRSLRNTIVDWNNVIYLLFKSHHHRKCSQKSTQPVLLTRKSAHPTWVSFMPWGR